LSLLPDKAATPPKNIAGENFVKKFSPAPSYKTSKFNKAFLQSGRNFKFFPPVPVLDKGGFIHNLIYQELLSLC
jgi:hypothetical protein